MRPDDYRTSIVLFSIKATNTDRADEYRLAIRAASTNAPSVEDVRASSATIVRKVSQTPINVHMGFHMDTTLFDDNIVWDDDNNAGQHILNDARVDEARLQPNTAYTLYGVLENGETEVLTLLSFNTDTHPADDVVSNTFLYNFPPDEYAFTISSGEPFLLDSVFLRASNSVLFKQSGVILTECSNVLDNLTLPPVNTNNNIAVIYFTSDIGFSGEKSRFSALTKNTNLKLNSGERLTIELSYGSSTLNTMNLIVE